MVGRVQRWLESAGRLPGVDSLRRARFAEEFGRGRFVGCCSGVFASATDAAAAAPKTRPLGYDHIDAAQMYRDRIDRLFPSDYPMMFWLSRVIASGARSVYDLGGHIGLSYYAYQRFIDFPADLRWAVHDVPAVMAAGRVEAMSRDPACRLTFTESHEAASGVDCFFTAGCLQYLEDTLAQRLTRLASKPRWVLVNLLPLHAQHAFWTVQSIGTSFCPYRIQQHGDFFADVEALGYKRLDVWENADKSCWIAFEPGRTLDRYYGVAFELGCAQ